MNAPHLDRDQRTAILLLLFAIALLISSNSLFIFDVPYFPLRFLMIVSAAIMMLFTVVWIVAKYHTDTFSLRLLLVAVSMSAAALVLQIEPVNEVAQRATGLSHSGLQHVVMDSLAETSLGLVVLITITAFIAASKQREQAIDKAAALDLAQKAVRVSDSKFRKLADSTAAMLLIHRGGRLIYVNPRSVESTGYTADELLKMYVWDLVDPEFRETIIEYSTARLRGDEAPERYEVKFITKDGNERWADLSATLIETDEGPAVLATVFDITDRKVAEEELLSKQRLLVQLLAAHDRERQLVAYEIHDGVAQDVAAALMHFESVDIEPPLVGTAKESFEIGLALLGKSIRESRNLISGLGPPILEEQGITAAIDYLINERADESGIQITYHHQISQNTMPRLVEANIFRIAQEALANIRQHSRAKRARIELTQDGESVHLEVQDWGIGFNPANVQEHQFGLRGIRDRASALDGTATIESSPGSGTRIRVDLPSMVRLD